MNLYVMRPGATIRAAQWYPGKEIDGVRLETRLEAAAREAYPWDARPDDPDPCYYVVDRAGRRHALAPGDWVIADGSAEGRATRMPRDQFASACRPVTLVAPTPTASPAAVLRAALLEQLAGIEAIVVDGGGHYSEEAARRDADRIRAALAAAEAGDV